MGLSLPSFLAGPLKREAGREKVPQDLASCFFLCHVQIFTNPTTDLGAIDYGGVQTRILDLADWLLTDCVSRPSGAIIKTFSDNLPAQATGATVTLQVIVQLHPVI